MLNHFILIVKEKKSNVEILTFGLASFFNDLGSDMIAPIWPLFVTTILGANMILLGFIDGLGIALVSISNAVSGLLSDKIGNRKIFIWVGYFLSGIARLGYFISPSWHYLIPFKSIDRVGKIRGAPRDALISEITTKKTRGKAFGLLRSLDSFGAVIGTLITYLIISKFGIRNILLFAAFPSFISSILIFLIIKERKIKKLHIPIKNIKLNKNLKLFFLISALFSFVTFSYSFLLIFAKNQGFSDSNIILLYFVFNIIYSIFSFQFGKLSDKFGRKIIVILSFIIYTIMCLSFTLVTSHFGVLLLFILFGFFNASWDPVKRTFVSELSPKNSKASVIGLYQMITGLLALPSGLIMGYLWEINYKIPFLIAGLTSLILIFLMKLIKEK
jgi:MFS family permease